MVVEPTYYLLGTLKDGYQLRYLKVLQSCFIIEISTSCPPPFPPPPHLFELLDWHWLSVAMLPPIGSIFLWKHLYTKVVTTIYMARLHFIVCPRVGVFGSLLNTPESCQGRDLNRQSHSYDPLTTRPQTCLEALNLFYNIIFVFVFYLTQLFIHSLQRFDVSLLSIVSSSWIVFWPIGLDRHCVLIEVSFCYVWITVFMCS